MKLEKLIKKRLEKAPELTRILAQYGGAAAIFFGEIPPKEDSLWEPGSPYPRIYCTYKIQAVPERKNAGTLFVYAVCKAGTEAVLDQIETQVCEQLTNVLLSPSYGSPCCFRWLKTDLTGGNEPLGERRDSETTVRNIWFDLIEYPDQETMDPDPVEAVNKYLKDSYPEAVVIGTGHLAEMTETGADSPVFYCRLMSTETDRETNTAVWLNCKISVHLLCKSDFIRRKMITGAARGLLLKGELLLSDGSYLFVKQVQTDHEADYITKGQLTITGNYGLLRDRARGHGMTAAEFNMINVPALS